MSTAQLAAKPATAARPAHVEAYERDGFFQIDDVFSPAEVEALRQACADDTMNQQRAREGADANTHHLLCLTGRSPKFLELARDPRIVEIIKPLIGADIQLQHAKLATKPLRENAGPYPFHQDLAYFPHTNTSLCAIMIMLDDATTENGCMYMVPGSHKRGMVDHRIRGTFSGGCTKQEGLMEQARPVTPRAGGISVHHCLTLHGSPPNRSGKPRRGIVFQYRADDAYQLADLIFPDTGTMIAGQRRGVVRMEAGAFVLPLVGNRHGGGFGDSWCQAGALAGDLTVQQPAELPPSPHA